MRGVFQLEKLDVEGRIYWPRNGGMPRLKQYLDDGKGTPLQDLWTDIPPINAVAKERLGWSTQKPIALLERIVLASSNPGDVVLDPFCGCGTALIAAQKHDRHWIGIDITYLSIAVMRARLKDSFALTDVEVIGQPTEVEGARQLAQASGDARYQFQWWALMKVDAQPVGGVQRKGADQGIDGKITFTDAGGKLESVLVSVKSDGVQRRDIADLKNSVEREKAAMGIFVTLEEATAPMRQEAATAAVYHSELWNRDYPRIQIITVRELLEEHRKPELPPFVLPTYQKAERVKGTRPSSRRPCSTRRRRPTLGRGLKRGLRGRGRNADVLLWGHLPPALTHVGSLVSLSGQSLEDSHGSGTVHRRRRSVARRRAPKGRMGQ